MLEPSSQSSAEVLSTATAVRKSILDWRGYAAVFGLALLVTTLHHCFEGGTKVALLFDGRHYFESCQRACALLLSLCSMHADKVVEAEKAFREYVMLDGPVLPLLFGAFYACFGHVPVSEDWTKLVWLQTVLQSLAAVLICKLSFQLTRRKLFAFICAGLWILYPSALIASGRLMTEDAAIVLLLSLPLLLRGAIGEKKTAESANLPLEKISQLFATNQYGFTGGVVSGLLILVKPGMIPSVVLTWLACLALSKQRLAVAISLLIGTGLALSPWLLYTKQTTGKAAITVQRMPVHNALIGWDPETRGWQTNPPSGFERVLNTGGEPITTIEGIWLSHPQECCKILFDKLGHLYSTPWNDYRAKALMLNAQAQELVHQGLLFAGLFGFAAWLFSPARRSRLALLCAAAAAGQCVYLMFEPVCRYAFPQFAFAPVFFSLALQLLLGRPRDYKAILCAGLSAIVSVGVILYSESSSNKYLKEVASRLDGNAAQTNAITLNQNALKNADSAWVLVDGDQNLEQAEVSVNGTKLDGHLLPLNYFDPQRYLALNLLKEVAYGLNRPITDFRIWRAIPIPKQLLSQKQCIVQITPPKTGCTIYGDKRANRNYLSPDFLCVNRLINSKTSLEARNESPIPAANQASGDKAQSSNLRVMLMLALPRQARAMNESTSNSLERKAVSKFERNLIPTDFDENLRTAYGALKIGKSILKAARTTGTSANIPNYTGATNLQITLRGELKAVGKPAKVGIVIETVTEKKRELFLGRLPSYLPTTKDWTEFTIIDLAPYLPNNERITSIKVALFPGPWQQVAGYGCDKTCSDTVLRDLKLEVTPVTLPTLQDKQMLYYH